MRRIRNVEHARIECDAPMPTQLDGELIGELETIELGVIKNGAHFLV